MQVSHVTFVVDIEAMEGAYEVVIKFDGCRLGMPVHSDRTALHLHPSVFLKQCPPAKTYPRITLEKAHEI